MKPIPFDDAGIGNFYPKSTTVAPKRRPRSHGGDARATTKKVKQLPASIHFNRKSESVVPSLGDMTNPQATSSQPRVSTTAEGYRRASQLLPVPCFTREENEDVHIHQSTSRGRRASVSTVAAAPTAAPMNQDNPEPQRPQTESNKKFLRIRTSLASSTSIPPLPRQKPSRNVLHQLLDRFVFGNSRPSFHQTIDHGGRAARKVPELYVEDKSHSTDAERLEYEKMQLQMWDSFGKHDYDDCKEDDSHSDPVDESHPHQRKKRNKREKSPSSHDSFRVNEDDIDLHMENEYDEPHISQDVIDVRRRAVVPPPVPFKTPKWLDLRPRHHSSSLTVRNMAWDEQGVLLAVVYEDKRLCVYDWDTVRCVDLQGRNRRKRRQRNRTSCTLVHPIVTIPLVSQYVSSLQWNPFNQDEIAVYMWDKNMVQVYDLGHVAAWEQHPVEQPPKRCVLRLPSTRMNAPASSQFLFADANLVIVSNQEQIVGISMASSKPQVCWQLKWGQTASMARIHKNLILLGSRKSRFMVIDYKKVERGSFASRPRPKIVVPQWDALEGLDCPRQWMDVTKIKLRVVLNKFVVTWMTPRGWILECTVSLKTGKATSRVVHATTRVAQYMEGRLCGYMDRWSEPAMEVAGDFTGEWSCIGHVPKQRMKLSTHDRYTVGNGETRIETGDCIPGFVLLSETCGTSRFVPLSRRYGDPTCVAIHPDGEWILVGTKKTGLEIMNARRRV